MGDIIFFYTKEGRPMLEILHVAEYFLSLGAMKHKKLQKLCYYAQAWFLALTGHMLMNTYFEAWVHGPVSPVLYERYREWGGLTIPKIDIVLHISFRDEEIRFLNTIYRIYESYSADELEQLTHTEEPWIEARDGYGARDICRVKIKEETMKRFYRELLKNG